VNGFVTTNSPSRFHFGIHSTTTTTQSTSKKTEQELALEIIATGEKVGQVGSKASKEDQQKMLDLADALAKFQTGENLTGIELNGVHNLVYSASKGGSSGAIGPFVGDVTQFFIDDAQFINGVKLGPFLNVQLYAERKIMDKNRIKVKFNETIISVFGQEVKRVQAKGQGVWNNLYVGEVQREQEKLLLRVILTPSLFVITQRIS